MARGLEFALGPERNLFVSSVPRKSYTFAHQARANTQTPCRGFNEQKAQLRDCLGFSYQENAADKCAILLSHPATLPFCVVIGDKFGHNRCHQGLEMLVVPVFLSIKNAMPVDDPTHISGLMIAQQVGRRGFLYSPAEDDLNRPHRIDQAILFRLREAAQHRSRFLTGMRLKWGEGRAPSRSESEQALAAIGFGRSFREQTLFLESMENPAEISRIQPQILP